MKILLHKKCFCQVWTALTLWTLPKIPTKGDKKYWDVFLTNLFPWYYWDSVQCQNHTTTALSYLWALELCCLHTLQHRGHVQRHRCAPVVNRTHRARTAVQGRRILPSNDRIWFIFLTFLTMATARLQWHSSNAHLTWEPAWWISSAFSCLWFCNILN